MSPTTPKRRPSTARPQDKIRARHLDRSLLRAAYDADIESAIAALDHGADVNTADPETGLSALHIAVGTNNLALTRFLVEDWGAQIKPDGRGRWLTLIAAQCRVDDDLSDYVDGVEETAIQRSDQNLTNDATLL